MRANNSIFLASLALCGAETSAFLLSLRQSWSSDLWSTAEKSLTGLEGVSEFETWFQECQGSVCDGRISHDLFGGSLRGLAWKGDIKEASGRLASVPSSIVLQADESQASWDAILASKLWKEVLKGRRSSIYGYVCLLTQDHYDVSTHEGTVPSSTAPNALRHWTQQERDELACTVSGQKLLELNARQQRDWQQKYQQLAGVDRPETFEQFAWAMEVVHSRAFRGLDQSLLSSLPSIVAPIAAAIVGWTYFSTTAFPDESIFVGLGILALLPSIVSLVNSKKAVVLLPLIDSANHMESVGSSIDYNPLSGAFELTVQPDCAVQEKNGPKKQLYISYGNKGDTELILNYGFLPGVESGDGMGGTARSEQRKQLAEAFQRRNV